MIQYLKDRLKERTTWAGIALIVSVFGLHIDPEIFQGIMLILGVQHVILPDQS